MALSLCVYRDINIKFRVEPENCSSEQNKIETLNILQLKRREKLI
jgi:hypothetical protein